MFPGPRRWPEGPERWPEVPGAHESLEETPIGTLRRKAGISPNS